MDERVVKFRVGVMIVATLLIVGILVMLFGELPSLARGTYTVYLWFPQTPGVAEGTPVRKDGILIGRVTDVKLIDAGGVVVTAQLDAKYKLRRNEICRLNSSLLGDAVLQFVPNGPTSTEFIQNGDYLEGNVAANPLQSFGSMEGDLNQAIGSVSTAGREIGRLAIYVNEFMVNNDEQINRIVDKTERALDTFQKAAGDFNDVLSDDQTREKLKKALADMPALLQETRDAVAKMHSTMSRAETNLQNLEGFTKPLGERGDQIVAKVDDSMTHLSNLLDQFGQFSTALNSKDSTLGRLVNDPDFYQHLNAAACNIEQLTKELKPIIRDVRAFTDKMARHPGVLLRDAVKPNSGIK